MPLHSDENNEEAAMSARPLLPPSPLFFPFPPLLFSEPWKALDSSEIREYLDQFQPAGRSLASSFFFFFFFSPFFFFFWLWKHSTDPVRTSGDRDPPPPLFFSSLPPFLGWSDLSGLQRPDSSGEALSSKRRSPSSPEEAFKPAQTAN